MGQLLQNAMPDVSAYIPSAHATQSESPETGLYLPRSHGMQIVSFPEKPGLQLQSNKLLLPEGEKVLFGQRMQAETSI